MIKSQPLPVLIASSLCYLWGVILLLLALMAATPIFSGHGLAIVVAAVFPLMVLVVAGAYCVTGYFIGRRRRLGAWMGVTLATLTLLLQLVMHLSLMWVSLNPAWVVIDVLLLVVLLANWRRFDQPR